MGRGREEEQNSNAPGTPAVRLAGVVVGFPAFHEAIGRPEYLRDVLTRGGGNPRRLRPYGNKKASIKQRPKRAEVNEFQAAFSSVALSDTSDGHKKLTEPAEPVELLQKRWAPATDKSICPTQSMEMVARSSTMKTSTSLTSRRSAVYYSV